MLYAYTTKKITRVAQLVRAFVLLTKGSRFESWHGYFFTDLNLEKDMGNIHYIYDMNKIVEFAHS